MTEIQVAPHKSRQDQSEREVECDIHKGMGQWNTLNFSRVLQNETKLQCWDMQVVGLSLSSLLLSCGWYHSM